MESRNFISEDNTREYLTTEKIAFNTSMSIFEVIFKLVFPETSDEAYWQIQATYD